MAFHPNCGCTGDRASIVATSSLGVVASCCHSVHEPSYIATGKRLSWYPGTASLVSVLVCRTTHRHRSCLRTVVKRHVSCRENSVHRTSGNDNDKLRPYR
jgi:hypothetical protein